MDRQVAWGLVVLLLLMLNMIYVCAGLFASRIQHCPGWLLLATSHPALVLTSWINHKLQELRFIYTLSNGRFDCRATLVECDIYDAISF